MRITQEADYAIRIVCLLAKTNEKIDANNIAQQAMITQRFALKILRKLVGAGIVKSFKGATGGYMLGKDADNITLLEIVETIDGSIQIMKCMNESHDCSCMGDNKSECVLHNIFSNISTEIAQTLSKITVEMVNTNNEAISLLFTDK